MKAYHQLSIKSGNQISDKGQYIMTKLVYVTNNKIEGSRDYRNSKSGNVTSSEQNVLNIRTNASPKLDRTRFPEEYASSVG